MNSVTMEIHTKEAVDDIEAAILRGLEACGMVAETYAKQGCPVDTGRLRNSIAHRVIESEKYAYIGTNVEYAAVQEFGENFHHTTGGPHFLKNAAGNHTEEYKELIKRSMINT